MKAKLPKMTLRELITKEVRRWESECSVSFQWTTADVIDFAELAFTRIMASTPTEEK